MGYQAWNPFTDYDYVRETLAWVEEEDALEAEALEQERAERARYASESEPFVIQGLS